MKKRLLKHLPQFMIAAVLFMLTSCVGISADIQIRKDGSGKINLEYRFSRMAETLGRLDGNEQWQIIPVGRADWERTTARTPGMKLVSFSSREEKKDIVNKVTLEFENTDALIKFLDPSGRRAVIDRGNSSSRLNIIINEPASSQIDNDLLELMRQVSTGYKLKLNFSADRNSTMTITDGMGNKINPPAEAKIISSGKNVSLEIEMSEILNLMDGLGVNLNW